MDRRTEWVRPRMLGRLQAHRVERPCAPRRSTARRRGAPRPMLLTCHRALEALRISIGQASSSNSCSDRTWRTTSGPSWRGRSVTVEPVQPRRTEGPSPARRTTWTWELPVRRRHDSHVRVRGDSAASAAFHVRWTPIWPSSSPPSSPPSSFAASLDTRRVGAGVRISPLTPTWTRRVISARNSSNKAGCRWRNTDIRNPPPREGTCTRRRGTRSNRSTVRCLHTVNHLRDITVRCPRTVNRLRAVRTDACTVNRRGRIRQRRRSIIGHC